MPIRQNLHVDDFNYPAGPPTANVANFLGGRLTLNAGVGQESLVGQNVPGNANIQLSYFGAAAVAVAGKLSGEIGVDGLGNPALNVFSDEPLDANDVFFLITW